MDRKFDGLLSQFHEDNDKKTDKEEEDREEIQRLDNFLLLSNSYDKILSKCEEMVEEKRSS